MREPARVEALSIPSDPVRFGGARNWLVAIARGAGFDASDTSDVAMALIELCADSHRLSYRGRTDGRIDLEAEVAEGRLRVTVRDYGESQDSGARRAQVPRDRGERNDGAARVRGLVDHVEFTSTGVGNRVVVTKRRRPPGG